MCALKRVFYSPQWNSNEHMDTESLEDISSDENPQESFKGGPSEDTKEAIDNIEEEINTELITYIPERP